MPCAWVFANRWAQYLAGISFLPAGLDGAPLPSLDTAGAAVLVGLSQYRAENRALRVLQALRSARPPSAGSGK